MGFVSNNRGRADLQAAGQCLMGSEGSSGPRGMQRMTCQGNEGMMLYENSYMVWYP